MAYLPCTAKVSLRKKLPQSIDLQEMAYLINYHCPELGCTPRYSHSSGQSNTLTTMPFFIFLTMIKPVALSYVCSYLTRLHNGKYCVGLVVNSPEVLRRLFLHY